MWMRKPGLAGGLKPNDQGVRRRVQQSGEIRITSLQGMEGRIFVKEETGDKHAKACIQEIKQRPGNSAISHTCK